MIYNTTSGIFASIYPLLDVSSSSNIFQQRKEKAHSELVIDHITKLCSRVQAIVSKWPETKASHSSIIYNYDY